MENGVLYKRRKRGEEIATIKEIKHKLNLSPFEMADAIGIKKSAYYNKINGLTDWTLPEIVKLTELNNGKVDIEVNGNLYRITIKKC